MFLDENTHETIGSLSDGAFCSADRLRRGAGICTADGSACSNPGKRYACSNQHTGTGEDSGRIRHPEKHCSRSAEYENRYRETADEFLEALDSNVSIRIDSELLDFSTASGYGENFGEHYRWVKEFDGPTLEIHDVENLQIIGNGKDKTTLQAVPRYADVLRFIDCKNLVLADFTAGHLKEAPGSCSGMVLTFRNCSNVSMQRCGLFGCGVNGIVGERSSHFSITDTEIYECSQLGAVLGECSDIVFEDCRVRDCGMNSISVNGTNGDLLYNGTTLKDGDNFVG